MQASLSMSPEVSTQFHSMAIATHGGLYVFVVDEKFDIMSAQQVDDGYHYGLTVDFDSDSNTSTIYAYRGGPGKEYRVPREIREWHFDGQNVTQSAIHALYEEAGDVHQISKFGKNGFLLTNSARNSIDRWHPQNGVMDRLHINDETTDVNHINSILPVDDLVAIMLHNYRKLESEILILEDDGSLMKETGRFSLKDYCCHNIGIIGSDLFINASSAQDIVKIDLKTLKETGRTRLSAHTKGMCCDGKLIFAGTSDCAARADRVASSGWLNIIDPQSLEVLKTVQLEVSSKDTGIGNVNEIRLLNSIDVFDSPGDVDVDALRNSAFVKQNWVEIACRRLSIRAWDKMRRTAGTLLRK